MCYTDRHSTVIAAKGSTLDRASDGRDGHRGLRHGAICQVVAEPGEAGAAYLCQPRRFSALLNPKESLYAMERKLALTGGVEDM